MRTGGLWDPWQQAEPSGRLGKKEEVRAIQRERKEKEKENAVAGQKLFSFLV